MKRRDFLHCAGLDDPRFKVLNAREQIPAFAEVGTENLSDHLRAEVARYSLREAFATRLMLDLIGNDDDCPAVGVRQAAKVISNALMTGYTHDKKLSTIAASGAWAGVGVFKGNVDGVTFTRWIYGTPATLAAWLGDVETREDAAPLRILIANAARAAQFVIDRACELPFEVVGPEPWA